MSADPIAAGNYEASVSASSDVGNIVRVSPRFLVLLITYADSSPLP